MNSAQYELLNRTTAEIARMPIVSIDISGTQLLMLVGQLQLALRHPANRGPSADWSRRWIRQVAEKMPPAVAETMALGFSREADVKPGEMLEPAVEKELLPTRTWPFGTLKHVVVGGVEYIHGARILACFELDGEREAHILIGDDGDVAHAGEHGVIEYLEGGPKGGFWQYHARMPAEVRA